MLQPWTARPVTSHRQTNDVAQLIAAIRRTPPAGPVTLEATFRGPRGSVGRRDSATHWLHWYPAKMFHEIPAAILNSWTAGPLTVLDPFCGSGTVLLEAALRGHRAIGVDVNPLARLIATTKTTRLEVSSLSDCAAATVRRARASRRTPDVDVLPPYWFLNCARRTLVRTHAEIQTIKHKPHRDFLRVSLSAIVRRSSLADPTIPPPVRLSVNRAKLSSKRYARNLERAFAITAPAIHAAFRERVEANVARMSELAGLTGYGCSSVLDPPAEAAATGLPSQSVDVIITSPPYCGAQKYVRSLRLEMLLLGFSPSVIAQVDRRTLGTERISVRAAGARLREATPEMEALIQQIAANNPKRALMVADYMTYLSRFAIECSRVLKIGGEAFVTFGTSHVTGIRVPWDTLFQAVASVAGLQPIAVLVDRIPSRGLMTARHRSSSTIDDERVVWLRRDQ